VAIVEPEFAVATPRRPKYLRAGARAQSPTGAAIGTRATCGGSPGQATHHFHPTMKPLELIERVIENSSKPSDIVLDLFLGSGSTLIAAERTVRVCYGMELDPHYGQVALLRWEEFSGEKARKL
jgi:hypothetical protein